MNGVLIINKPMDFTSFDVVAVVRRITGQRKAGHTGTLDPNATGVLPILLGSATKAQDLILNHDKSYIADFQLGITTDTLDVWGNVKSMMTSNVKKEEIIDVISHFRGEIEQIPPMFSAIQKDGKRLYELARKGIEVVRDSRKVTIYKLELIEFDENNQRGKLEMSCSKGTYVRTLIDDMGRTLGTGAVMTALVRTSACGFTLDDCIALDTVKRLAEDGVIEQNVKSVESLFESCEYIRVSDAQAKRFSNGGALDMKRTCLKNIDVKDDQIFRVKDRNDSFLGLGITDRKSGQLKIYLQGRA